ncbi:MAG: hypothetical protein ACLFNS_07485 [Desulfobacterales bacterium]
MNPCEDCAIEDKLYECCGRHPENGAVVDLELNDNRIVTACPHLSANGTCLIYDSRPYGCRMYYCDRYFHQTRIGEGYLVFLAQWGLDEAEGD